MSVREQVALKELPALLLAQGLNNLHAIRSVEELVYTGVVFRSNASVCRTNELYWLHEEAHQKGSDWTDKTAAIWSKIEATEMSLRDFVFRRYETEWTDQTTEIIKAVIGKDDWEKIQRNYEAASKKYPLSDKTELRIVDLMYIGQLLMLIVYRKAWHLFQPDFKDKQYLANIFASITPVRNDRAHFNPVPEKELLRCYIACDDLSVLIDRAEKRTT